METLKAILDTLLRKRREDPNLKGYPIFEGWEGAVGSRIARHSQPKRFRDNVLWVSVDNSIWMQQLKFLEGQIREKLNQITGSPMVEKIRFEIGEINFSPQQDPGKDDLPRWQDTPLDNKVQENIEKEVAVLKDEELKESLKNLFRKSARFLHYQGKE